MNLTTLSSGEELRKSTSNEIESPSFPLLVHPTISLSPDRMCPAVEGGREREEGRKGKRRERERKNVKKRRNNEKKEEEET